jgi:hypothetical protein
MENSLLCLDWDPPMVRSEKWESNEDFLYIATNVVVCRADPAMDAAVSAELKKSLSYSHSRKNIG